MYYIYYILYNSNKNKYWWWRWRCQRRLEYLIIINYCASIFRVHLFLNERKRGFGITIRARVCRHSTFETGNGFSQT